MPEKKILCAENTTFQHLYFADGKYCYKYLGSVSDILHQMPTVYIIMQKYELQVNTYVFAIKIDSFMKVSCVVSEQGPTKKLYLKI
jgi:hypothetical protein